MDNVTKSDMQSNEVIFQVIFRKSIKRILDGLKLFQQKEPSKILSTTRLLLFQNKVLKDNIFDIIRLRFLALIYQIVRFQVLSFSFQVHF